MCLISRYLLSGRSMVARRDGDIADLLALVADALQVGDGLDDGDDQAQVTGRRRARGEDAAALLVDRPLPCR